jgi:SNF2 family DNA or RNA helicase
MFLVCPVIPYASLVKASPSKSHLINTFFAKEMSHNKGLKITDSVSSRIQKVLEVLNGKHPSEKCVVFNCFRKTQDVCEQCIEESGREVFCVKDTDKAHERMDTIKDFEESENGILLLTYQLGAEGLNIQCSHVVLLVDVWWNDGRVQQAIARVLRRGQTEKVQVYFFTSNTGIEKGLFHKHVDKRKLVGELMEGPTKGKVRVLDMKEVIRLVLDTETSECLMEARKETKR